jgi:hypothetical protein
MGRGVTTQPPSCEVDTFGKCDAYAVAFWNGVEVGRTAVAANTLEPRWEVAFDVLVHPGEYIRGCPILLKGAE